jgi:glycosyltransferase involved in cell wall biosynthesis
LILDAKDVVKNGFNGHVLPFGNKGLWVDTIKNLVENVGLRKKLGENARQFALENFSELNFKSVIIDAINRLTNVKN